METNRRNFFKKACAAGACLCGFSSVAGESLAPENENTQQRLLQDWISVLMVSLDKETDEALSRQIMRSCARTHYDQLQMDTVLEKYVGNLHQFVQFLKNSWNWQVNFDEVEGIIQADENKSVCVCPMVSHQSQQNLRALCYCSEGFAELMFSKVAGHPVEARVLSSIHRGDKTCRYEIKL